LKKSNLSREQIQKLLDEVSKAVDPASDYGKVKDLLNNAVAQMKQGQQPGAAQSLADAAKELEKLLQQMGDAQSLQATLEALQKAQMCVGTGKSWAQCKSPGMGKGGKPGRGVGTWADDTGWLYYPEVTERWDNSGLVRPDMDPRGLTDRGEGELSDNLAPTKIHGQINPGGSMPSITLRGVSIKGQSKVQYEEAVKAAQTEAQSALNQDQVPKAYQGAVKNYFDDLKE
jgi:HPt (histidine-containing phosphotransfer) domain-containing protein